MRYICVVYTLTEQYNSAWIPAQVNVDYMSVCPSKMAIVSQPITFTRKDKFAIIVFIFPEWNPCNTIIFLIQRYHIVIESKPHLWLLPVWHNNSQNTKHNLIVKIPRDIYICKKIGDELW